MRTTVILALCFAAVAQGALVNMDRCLKAKDACYNYATAADCDMLNECKEGLWSLPTNDSTLCLACKDEVGKLQDWIKSKATEEAVEKDLITFCKAIPLKAVSDECQQLVIEHFDQIYDDLIAMLDPDVVCTALHLCNEMDMDKKAEEMMLKLPDLAKKALLEGKLPMAAPFAYNLPGLESDDDCSDCEAFMTDFKNTVMNNKKVVSDWMAMLKQECEALGSALEPACNEEVNVFMYQITMGVEQNSADVKTACKAMQMCGMFQNKRAGDPCTDCKTFFSDWQQMLKTNPSLVNHVVDVVSQIYCLQKPPEQQEQCARYVAMVIKVLLDQVEREDVGKICQKLEFCPPQPALPKHDWKKVAKSMAKVVMQKMPSRKLKVNADHCDDCRAFIKDLQGVITNNASIVQELVDLVKQECSELGPELEPVCVALINDHYKELLQKFVAGDVDTICTTIMMCTEETRPSNGDLCSDCEAFFTDWQDIITNNKSVINERLKEIKKQVCEQVPFILRPECDKVFDEVADNLMDAIQKTDASEICATLYFCDYARGRSSSGLNVQAITRQATAMKKYEVGGDVECQACQFAVSEVEKLVEENATEEAIVSTLQKICDLYGADIREECKHFMETNVASIVDFVIQEVNTLELCAKIGLCKNGKRFKMIKPKKVKSPVLCQLCELVVDEITKNINVNSTEEEIEEAVEKVCTVIPQKYRTDCDNFVHTYGREVIDLLVQGLTNPVLVCTALRLCYSVEAKVDVPKQIEAHFSPSKAKELTNDLECDLCQSVVTQVEALLMQNKTEDEIVDALISACGSLGQYKEECTTLVNDYAREIIELIVKDGKPETVCAAIKLCTAAPKVKVGNEVECQLCEAVAKQLESLLTENSTEKEIIAALDKVCSYLPASDQDECKDLVDQYGPAIISLLVEEFAPGKLCKDIGLCTDEAKKVVKVKVGNAVECDLCEAVAKQLESLLTENSTESEIVAALDKVCTYLPATDQAECKDLVEEYTPVIVSFLVEEFAPGRLCKDIGLCTSEANKVEKRPETPESDEFCDVCKAVAEQLDNMLKENSTEEEITKALEEVCSLLPAEFKDTCDGLIKQYAPQIIELLIEEMAPSRICVDLKLCASIKNVEADVSCDVCQFVARELEGLLTKNSTEAEIEKALEEVCQLLPSTIQQECDTLIMQYGDTIVQILVEEFNPAKICTAIELCHAASNAFKKVKSNAGCPVCEVIMTELKTVLNEQSTKEEIVKAVEEVCQLVPEEDRSVCKQYIDNYGPGVISILIEDFVPDEVCKTLGLCQRKDLAQVKQVNADECGLCKEIITFLDKVLEDNATEADVIRELERICTFLPSQFTKQCDSMVDEYGSMIFQYIDEIGDPNYICEHLKLCPTEAKKLIVGVNPCTYGPSYWCDSIEKAKECNAVSHCMNHVWD